MAIKLQIGETLVMNTGEIVEVARLKAAKVVLKDSNLCTREVDKTKLLKNLVSWNRAGARKYNLETDPTRIRSEYDGFYTVNYLDYDNCEATIKFDNSQNSKVVDIFTALNGLAIDRVIIPENVEGHYVYAALHNEVIYYIGQGKDTRYKHVNSGTSHSYDLNWHHFNNYDFHIRIFRDQMTKEESLALEEELIRRYQPRCNRTHKN